MFCVFGFDHQASHAVWVLVPALLGLVYGLARRLSASVAGTALALLMFCLLIVRSHFWVDRRERWKNPRAYPSVPQYLTPWAKLIAQDEWLEPVYTDWLVSIYRLK